MIILVIFIKKSSIPATLPLIKLG